MEGGIKEEGVGRLVKPPNPGEPRGRSMRDGRKAKGE
jgi:hypothetical protein